MPQLRLVNNNLDEAHEDSGPNPTQSNGATARRPSADRLTVSFELPAPHEQEPELRGIPRATLPFPTAAVHVLNRERIGRLTTPVRDATGSLAQLEAGINKHLDRAQQLVNQLHEEVESLKFPSPDDLPPGPPTGPRPRAA